MDNLWELPSTIMVNGIDYPIRTDYRVVLDVINALSDPNLIFDTEQETNYAKACVMIEIMIINHENLPYEHWGEAVDKICDFIDMGIKQEKKDAIKLMDWNKDAAILAPAINNVLHAEIRNVKMHWWTFLGAYMEIGDSLFSNVLHIRSKLSKKQKLEKHERKFYMENKSIIDMEKQYSQEELEEQEMLISLME